MLGEKKRWFKILTWDKYKKLKDKPLEYENELIDLRTQVKTKNSEITELENKNRELKSEVSKLKDEASNKNLEITSLKNSLEAKDDEINKIKQAHSLEKSELRNENKEIKKELKALKEKGVTVPKKVPGSTSPRKGQAIKETVRPVKN